MADNTDYQRTSSMAPMDIVADGMLSLTAAARHSGLSRSQLYVLMADGALSFCKVGKRRLVPKRDLDRVLAEGLVLADGAKS